MKDFAELFKSADWKSEKHAPVIECPDKIAAGEVVNITASVGKEIVHPNTTAHFISWIELYFLPEGGQFPYQIGRADFSAHGASAEGADSSGVYTEPFIAIRFKTEKPGTIYATSYCNIHGLWKSAKEITVK